MVQSIIDIDNRADRVLNIVKAQHGLKNKSQAVALVLKVYEESFLESELRPKFIEELKRIRKGKYHKFNNIEDLRKLIEEN